MSSAGHQRCVFYERYKLVGIGKEYIFTVLTAAVICGCITFFFGKKKTYGKLISMLCGLFMVITVISPWTNMDFSNVFSFADSINTDGTNIARSGQENAYNALSAIIIDACEAYILEEAKNLGADIQITVTLSEDEYPVPQKIAIEGNVSPYAKAKLTTMIEGDVGIPKERQIWT